LAYSVVSKNLRQVAGLIQVGVALHVQQAGRGGGQEGSVRGRGHLRHLLQQLQVLRMLAEFESPITAPIGSPPKTPNSSS